MKSQDCANNNRIPYAAVERMLASPKMIRLRSQNEQYLRYLAWRQQQHGSLEQDEIDRGIAQRREIDKLAYDLLHSNERLCWEDIPTAASVDAEAIVRECAYNTESVYCTLGVEVLAAYLDAMGYEGVLWQLAKKSLLSVRAVLEATAPMTDEQITVLKNPCHYFQCTEPDLVRYYATEYFSDWIHVESAEEAKHACIAHIEWGLGNPIATITSADFAWYHIEQPLFGDASHPIKNQQLLYRGEVRKAKWLLSILATMPDRHLL
jgi:hypothetical protein